jgi:hypothetical protein
MNNLQNHSFKNLNEKEPSFGRSLNNASLLSNLIGGDNRNNDSNMIINTYQ